MHQLFVPIGGLGVFGLFWSVLIDSTIATVGFVSIQSLCTCVHMLDASEWFQSLSSSSACFCHFLPGELGVLTCFDMPRALRVGPYI